MITRDQIRRLAEEKLEGTDRFLVEVLVKPGNRIMIFIDSDSHVSIDHCVELSRHIEKQLDRESDDFELNVSSSGLDQPYKLSRQYIKNIGREVSVTDNEGNKVTGILKKADENGFEVIETRKIKKEITEKLYIFSYSEIKETKEIIKF